ncbi:MAG: ComEC/Rec2 family competence protein [Spirochaetaceae bacterium]|nr:MAG: ComEC/Rec2 family competence protein [Spirochaetaceae bacterium]
MLPSIKSSGNHVIRGWELHAGAPSIFFASIAALTGIFSVYISDSNLSWALIFLSFPFAAAGVAFRTYAVQKTKYGLVPIAVAVGLFVGGIQSLGMEANHARAATGIPLDHVKQYVLVLDGDTIRSATGNEVFSGHLESVSSNEQDITTSACGTVLVIAKDTQAMVAGDRIAIKAGLSPAQDDAGASFISFAKGRDITLLGMTNPLFLIRKQILQELSAKISLLGDRAPGFFKALFLGIRTDLDFSLRESFLKTGSLHLLALSGLNVGMVVFLVMFLLYPLADKRIKVIISVVIAVFYLFLAGPSPSLVRAVLMVAIGGICYLLSRETRALDVLAASACIMLLVAPADVKTLSFQLSYAALAGILILGKRIDSCLIPWLPSKIRALVSMTLSAQVFTLPLVFSAFGAWYPSGIVASLFLIPMVTIFFWAGLLLLPISLVPVPAIQFICGFIMDFLYDMIGSVAQFFAQAPGVVIKWENWYWIPSAIICIMLASRIPGKIINELRQPKGNTKAS